MNFVIYSWKKKQQQQKHKAKCKKKKADENFSSSLDSLWIQLNERIIRNMKKTNYMYRLVSPAMTADTPEWRIYTIMNDTVKHLKWNCASCINKWGNKSISENMNFATLQTHILSRVKQCSFSFFHIFFFLVCFESFAKPFNHWKMV